MLHHHNRRYVDVLDADRRAAAAQKRRSPAGEDELHALVQAARTGNREAWQALLERFTPRVRAVARRYRPAAQDVEDVVQTTWMRLLEHIDSVREPGALGAWLETTARRESLRVLRAAQRERPTDDAQVGDAPVAPVAEQRLMTSDERVALGRALSGLPHHQRRLVAALFAEPAPSYAEISGTLGVPIGSIGPTRARILASLRRAPGLASAVAG
jgi:RNA polymerase sigma factor (sigma-70 family)